MRGSSWNPVFVYLAVFGAVVAVEMAYHAPSERPVGAVHPAMSVQPGRSMPPGDPELRRIAQRMLLR